MLKRILVPAALALCLFAITLPLSAPGQAAPTAGVEAGPAAAGPVDTNAAKIDTSFWQVMTGSGWVGVVLWIGLFATSAIGVALVIDSFINVKEDKIMPEDLIEKVKTAMSQGDVMKALKHCEDEPGPLSNVLVAGFSNVEEGFEAIQESVHVAADLESEKLLQRVNYLNVNANIAPMLGLLGTVQGMIFAFEVLASAGPAGATLLALAISQALWTTAYGLCIAIPCMAFFYFFRNKATRIILTMEALTMDQIKVLRNVEVVEG